MTKQPSGYTSFDFLNQRAATDTQPTQTKFGSTLTSISDLLKTATDTVVTMDGVINRGGNNSSGTKASPVLYPGQGASSSTGSGDMIKYASIAGIAIGGGILLLKMLKK
ncbi:MAG TPA: hypothetical protein DD671_14800 [Balneolaceae bacterium]|nr:hypothetical protein [Balneola sp.]HBQ60843.1 hypothetical protein [Balneolaceae bacterium]|tara:strand:+ start:1403 stop:1729 length:327 start_codon:yes stop_codon:yes gene_type:complete